MCAAGRPDRRGGFARGPRRCRCWRRGGTRRSRRPRCARARSFSSRERGGRCAWRGPRRAPSWSRTRPCGWGCCRCALRCADRRACGRARAAIWRSVGSVSWLGSGRAGVEKAGLAQADDQPVAAHLHRDGVGGDLVGELLFQLAMHALQIVLDVRGREHILAHHDVHGKALSWRFTPDLFGGPAGGVGKDAQRVEGRVDGLGDLHLLLLIGLGKGEQDHEEAKEQGDEVGIGDQPAVPADVALRRSRIIAASPSVSLRERSGSRPA